MERYLQCNEMKWVFFPYHLISIEGKMALKKYIQTSFALLPAFATIRGREEGEEESEREEGRRKIREYSLTQEMR